MALYVVTYSHPDAEGWARHVMAHVDYLQALLKQGVLRASGPFVGTPDRSAMLVMAADNQQALLEIISQDPFAIEGLIHDMTISEWDPIFGAFNADSSYAGRAPGG
ncbi:MAG: YciI family protein [Caulobacter sp.]|nr:YciI family protein [Caulobacter sp.]